MYHVPNELIIAAYGSTMILKTLPESKIDLDTSTDICMKLITVCWVMNMVCSSLVSGYGVYIKIRDYIRKRRAQTTSRVYTMKTVPEEVDHSKTIDLNYNKTIDLQI